MNIQKWNVKNLQIFRFIVNMCYYNWSLSLFIVGILISIQIHFTFWVLMWKQFLIQYFYLLISKVKFNSYILFCELCNFTYLTFYLLFVEQCLKVSILCTYCMVNYKLIEIVKCILMISKSFFFTIMELRCLIFYMGINGERVCWSTKLKIKKSFCY